MTQLWNFIGFIISLIVSFTSGIYASTYMDEKSNSIKFIDIQHTPAGGLAAANIKNGVKVLLTDEKGKKIDGYSLHDINIFNYSGRPIDEAKIKFAISKPKQSGKTVDTPLRALTITTLHDGMINEAAKKTITTQNDQNGTLIITVTLNNLSPDTTLEARHKISISMAGYQPLNLVHSADGNNIKSRDFDYRHALEADDPYLNYKETAAFLITPIALLACLTFIVLTLIYANKRDKDLFTALAGDIETYLNTQSGLLSGAISANSASIEIRNIAWKKYIDNIPRPLRYLMAKPT